MEVLNPTDAYSILIIALVIIGYSHISSKYIKIDIELAPALVVSAFILSMYISSLFDSLYVWSIGFILSGLFFFLLYVISLFRKKSKIEPTYVILLILFTVIGVKLSNVVVVYNDDFSHWALAIFDMFRSDGISTNESYIALLDYPPGTALYQYMALQAHGLFNHEFSESIAMAANNTLYVVFTLPLVVWAYHKNKILSVGVVVLLYLLMMSLYNMTEQTLNVDIIISSIFGFIILIWWRFGTSKILYLALPMAILPLIKISGLFFAIIASVLLLFSTSRKRDIGDVVGVVALILFVVCGVNATWKDHVNQIGFESTISSSASIGSIYQVLLNPSEGDINIISAFIEIVFTVSMNNVFPVYIGLIFMILGLLILAIDKEKRRNTLILAGVMASGLLLYLVGLLLTYLLSFPYEEGVVSASIGRYVYIYISGWVIAITGILLGSTFSDENISSRNIVAGLVFIYILAFSMHSNNYNYTGKRVEYNIVVNETVDFYDRYSKVFNSGDAIYFISNGKTPAKCNILRYIAIPVRVNYTFERKGNADSEYSFLKSCNISSNPDTKLGFSRRVTPSVWAKELIEKYTYLMIDSTGPYFKKQFGMLFEKPDDIGDETLFKVNISNGKLKLILVHEPVR